MATTVYNSTCTKNVSNIKTPGVCLMVMPGIETLYVKVSVKMGLIM